jgi:hypothetical protein
MKPGGMEQANGDSGRFMGDGRQFGQTATSNLWTGVSYSGFRYQHMHARPAWKKLKAQLKARAESNQKIQIAPDTCLCVRLQQRGFLVRFKNAGSRLASLACFG